MNEAVLWIDRAEAYSGRPSKIIAYLEGREVRASDGAVVGTIAKVIAGADGRPLQVLVQPKGARPTGPRSLPYKALSADGERFVIPLSKAEFESMPAVDLAAK